MRQGGGVASLAHNLKHQHPVVVSCLKMISEVMPSEPTGAQVQVRCPVHHPPSAPVPPDPSHEQGPTTAMVSPLALHMTSTLQPHEPEPPCCAYLYLAQDSSQKQSPYVKNSSSETASGNTSPPATSSVTSAMSPPLPTPTSPLKNQTIAHHETHGCSSMAIHSSHSSLPHPHPLTTP